MQRDDKVLKPSNSIKFLMNLTTNNKCDNMKGGQQSAAFCY